VEFDTNDTCGGDRPDVVKLRKSVLTKRKLMSDAITPTGPTGGAGDIEVPELTATRAHRFTEGPGVTVQRKSPELGNMSDVKEVER
jgi:hypothetical protein